MLRRRAALGVHHPIFRLAAQLFGEFLGSVSKDIAEPGFTPRATLQQSFDRFEIAPFQFEAISFVGTEYSLFPSLERQTGPASVVAALDAEIVDAL